MRRKLTDRSVSTLKTDGPRLEIFDQILPGFGVRVTKSGVKTFFVMYRMHGRLRRLSLGRYNPPLTTLASARTAAQDALRKAQAGQDPADEKAERRASGSATFGELWDDYLSVRTLRREKEQRWAIEHDCHAWKKRAISTIARRDVRALLDTVVARGAPVMANRLRSYLHAFFAWCVEREAITVNPVTDVAKPVKEVSRDRVLTDPELKAVWLSADAMGYPFGPFIQTLMLTAQRRGEVAGMRWDDLILTGDNPLWQLSASAVKSGRPHVVPLAPQVVTILETLPRFKGPYVFTAQRGESGIAGWTKYIGRLAAPVDNWTMHDLRRTAASGMARLGYPPHVVEKVLNHSGGAISGIAAIYNRHDYSGEMRNALTAWGRHVDILRA